MSKKIDYTGLCGEMNNGQKAIIIASNGYNDCTIKFEDGTLVRHKSVYEFNNGSIKNPNYLKNKRMGITKLMNCGIEATINNYRSTRDMDVRFVDGSMAYHVEWASFNRGLIAHPSKSHAHTKVKKVSYVGQSFLQHCGYTATIIESNRNYDNTICWNDPNKSISHHISIAQLKRGNVCPPSAKRAYCKHAIGEVYEGFNGLHFENVGTERVSGKLYQKLKCLEDSREIKTYQPLHEVGLCSISHPSIDRYGYGTLLGFTLKGRVKGFQDGIIRYNVVTDPLTERCDIWTVKDIVERANIYNNLAVAN